MAKMITYNQVQDLPDDHPLMVEFREQLRKEDEMFAAIAKDANENGTALDDEESLAYFDRYIAGDR